jgi:ABC-type Mn2+/Zn2+ transport system permease subunit
VSVLAFVCRRPFLLLCVDPDQADTSGFPARRYHAVMLAMVAASIVISFQAVGTLLVFGMLLAPAATGALVARRIGSMVAVASAVGALSTWIGLLLGYHADLAAGAGIVLSATVIFFVVLVVTRLMTAGRSREEAA